MNHSAYADIVSRVFPGAALRAVVRLAGGVSRDVHRLDLELSDGRAISLVARARGASHSGLSADLEYRLLRALRRDGVAVPEPLLVVAGGDRTADPSLVTTFVEGTSEVPAGQENRYIRVMADTLARIHSFPVTGLPTLPKRIDPLPEVMSFLPEGDEWRELRAHLRSSNATAYADSPTLLHGDFWPENLLWENGAVAAVLDWEDAAIGDPLSDVACCRLELRYRFGRSGMQRFTRAYAMHRAVDRERLALWQVYVGAAAQRFMGEWGLAPEREESMRAEARASIREAGAALLGRTTER